MAIDRGLDAVHLDRVSPDAASSPSAERAGAIGAATRGGVRAVLRVAEAAVGDVGGAVARIDGEYLRAVQCRPGEPIRVVGTQNRSIVLRGMPIPEERAGRDLILLDGIARRNVGVGMYEAVTVEPARCGRAVTVRLKRSAPSADGIDPYDAARLPAVLAGIPVQVDAQVGIPGLGHKGPLFRVTGTTPAGPVIIHASTHIIVEGEEQAEVRSTGVSYEDVGGLERELQRIREIIELPLRHPQLFRRLGIVPPKGVLLYGPPGSGKTLVARAVAQETRAHFIHINGPEIVHKLYGESEARLRELFAEAKQRAPSIIFIDEIDALAPRRAEVLGEVEKRLVAQFLALMDGFVARGQVVVIGATNLPDAIDPALRRPGRFDREIEIGVPNRPGRLQILRIHARSMPLGDDASLEELADRTPGYIGADLAALCQEAGLAALRRLLRTATPAELERPGAEGADVRREDFVAALRDVEPTASREIAIERSRVRFSDVGGFSSVKSTLASITTPGGRRRAAYLAAGATPPRGVLFTGPPGCGKTLLAKALVGELDLPLIEVDGPLLFSKWQGESERGLAEVFGKARRAAPCGLLIDEIDALAPGRSRQGRDNRMVAQLLKEIDRLAEFPDLLLLAATNRPDLVDPALLRTGRFDLLVRLDPPDEADRLAILAVCAGRATATATSPIGRGLKDVDLRTIAAVTAGFSGSDLEALWRRAAQIAVEAEGIGVGRAHLEQALKEVAARLPVSRTGQDQADA